MAEVLTYDSLITDIPKYANKLNDAALAAQIPRLIMYAENRVATDLKTEGTKAVVTATFTPNNPTIAKPAFWRDTVSFTGTRADGSQFIILPRSKEYCSVYWPTVSKTGEPRFYADYNFDNFLIVPTPAAALEFELAYHARQDPLDAETQTNWLTVDVPQLLLYACMLETQLWLKNDDGVTRWGNMYKDSLQNLQTEDTGRKVDATTVPK